MSDDYASGTFRWWHLSKPSPELIAAEGEGWLGTPGTVVDFGCGLGTEVHYLAYKGWKGAWFGPLHSGSEKCAAGSLLLIHPGTTVPPAFPTPLMVSVDLELITELLQC